MLVRRALPGLGTMRRINPQIPTLIKPAAAKFMPVP